MQYRFGRHKYDAARFELLRDGAAVPLRPRALSLLHHLIENRTRLVTKDELIDVVWQGRIVSDSAITVTLRTLRWALGEDRNAICTIYGKGLRFSGEVLAIPGENAVADDAPADSSVGPPEEGRPSIAVLPFRLVGIAGPHATLAEALPDDIITSLTRLRWLFVIARGSTFRFPSYDFRLADVGRELQVRYCLSGAMEIVGDRLHLTVELGETVGETVIWRESFETLIRGAHELRDEIVYRVACELDRRMSEHEIAMARLKNPANLGSWGAYHRGLGKVYTHGLWDLDGALTDFGRAIEFDPMFARGYAGLAHTRWLRTMQRPIADRPVEAMAMLAAAQQAEALDPLDPAVVAAAGRAKWMVGETELARHRFARAIELAPSFAQAYANLAGLQVLLRESEEGLRVNGTAIALSPLDPNLQTWLATQMGGLIQLERFDEAADCANRALELPRSMLAVLSISLVAYHRAERTRKGQRLARKIAREFPDLTATDVGMRYPMLRAQSEVLADAFTSFGLRAA